VKRDSSVAEFILSQILRSFHSLRMTEEKGSLRMTEVKGSLRMTDRMVEAGIVLSL